jgi:hypothetical protein
MALSPKQKADLLALALGEPPASAAVAVTAVPEPTITPTQPEPKPAAEAVAAVPKRVPNSVMVALREAAAERSQDQGPSVPPGIRPEFAHKPMARQRPGQSPAIAPIREGELRVDLALWERQQEIARELARDEWVRSRGHDPYARMHTSMRGDD